MGGGAPVAEQNPLPQGQNNPAQADQNSPSKVGKKSSNSSPTKQFPDQNQLGSRTKNNKGKSRKNQIQLSPKCEHKMPAQFVCLSEKCKTYPFYSSSCDKNCYNKHIHASKVVSIRIKQLQNKIENFPKVGPILLEQIQSYKQTLKRLKKVIHDFTAAETQELQNLQKSKCEQLSQEALKLRNKIQNQKFAGITGSLLSKLWSNVKFQDEEQQLQECKYIKQKMNNVQELGKCFKEILSNFSEKDEDQQQEVEQEKPQKKKVQKSYHMFKRYKLYDDMSLGKQGAWNNTLQP